MFSRPGFSQTNQLFDPSLDPKERAAEIEELLTHLAEPTPTPLFSKMPDTRPLNFAKDKAASVAQRRRNRPQTITIDSNGAHAEFGEHKVLFDGNLKAPEAIDTTLPDGRHLRSHILGLCYYDPASGESVMIADVKDCSGEVTSDDTIIYRDAFDGVAADVSYIYTASALEQNVIIRRRLPEPEKFGLSSESARLAVLTEFSNSAQPRKVRRAINLSRHAGALGNPRLGVLEDETLYFGSMRMVEGKAFTLGENNEAIPVGKRWLELEPGRWFLMESTPYSLLKSQLETLSASLSRPKKTRTAKTHNLKSLLKETTEQAAVKAEKKNLTLALGKVDSDPGVVVDYLLVNVPLLNIDLINAGKYGFAAIGQTTSDFWNGYDCYGCNSGWLSNLYWSDSTSSSAGIIVSNAPDYGYSQYALDPMYGYFIYGSSNAHATVTITNLPADVYDIFVYAVRATDVGAPSIELKRGSTSIKQKNLTYWGNAWYSSSWEEGNQYVRFRNIAVTNQSLTLDSYPDAAGYATFSGIQIIPSDALPSEAPAISKLINVNFAANDAAKVGFAAVGLTTNDFWTGYNYNYTYSFTLSNLKWSDQTISPAGLTVLNAPGSWGTSLVTDPMLSSYKYPFSSGNLLMSVTNLPTGSYNFYIYSPSSDEFGHNSVMELWSGDVPYGIKGTTLKGLGPNTNLWEVGQQFVLFHDVAVYSNSPVTIHVKHGPDGYALISGLQIACTTNSLDSDDDGLPDAWEIDRIGTLDYPGGWDVEADGLSNYQEYQLGLDPFRYDSNGNGINDSQDCEFPWIDDTTPAGAYLYSNSESWNWCTDWYDGTGWNGATLYPKSGSKMHVSANVPGAMHQHYFERSVEVMRAAPGDVLYAYVNLDPAYPPSEIMLQFYVMESNGSYSWEHRAYWGANNIATGVAGTASRYYMGPIPGTNQWVRLAVPAYLVGVESKIIEGMTFTLFGGRAAWDTAGRMRPVDTDGDGIPDYQEDANGNGTLDSGETDPNNPSDSGLRVFITRPRNGSNLP